MNSELLQKVKEIQHHIEQAAREIYYAKNLITNGDFAAAQYNLDAALKQLGVTSPKDVYLSNSVLDRK